MMFRLLIMSTLFSLTFAATPLTEGNAQSPVRVIIYEDLQCSDCEIGRAHV